MTSYIEKPTIKYRKLREITRQGKAVDHKGTKYDSDVFAFKRKLSARNKIEEMLEAKELAEL